MKPTARKIIKVTNIIVYRHQRYHHHIRVSINQSDGCILVWVDEHEIITLKRVYRYITIYICVSVCVSVRVIAAMSKSPHQPPTHIQKKNCKSIVLLGYFWFGGSKIVTYTNLHKVIYYMSSIIWFVWCLHFGVVPIQCIPPLSFEWRASDSISMIWEIVMMSGTLLRVYIYVRVCLFEYCYTFIHM